MPASRASAAAAAVSTVAGTVLLGLSVVAIRRLWLEGYVSEAGVPSNGHAGTYGAGIVLVSAGQALFAVALLGFRSYGRVVWLTAGLLGLAAAFGGVSGTVSCSPGCPLPPHETTTAMDFVHGGASILAVGCIGLALLAIAVLWPPVAFRRLARTAAWILVPLGAASGLSILVVGHGMVTGLLERAVLVAAVAWTVTACLYLARSR